MAHEHKLDTVLDDNTNYIDWWKELDVWVELTELPEEKKALAIFSSLKRKPEKIALQLKIKDLEVRGGVTKLKEKLYKAFSKDKKKATYDAYENFEDFLSVQMNVFSWLYNRIWRTFLLSRKIFYRIKYVETFWVVFLKIKTFV